jgi:hypothetical protein
MDEALLLSLPSGNDPAVLPQVGRWNWGALLLNWIWAFAHRLPLLGAAMLGLELVGLAAEEHLFPRRATPLLTQSVTMAGGAIAIYLAIMGNELAWRKRPFRSLEEFRATQRAWANWGIGFHAFAFLVGVTLFAVQAIAIWWVFSRAVGSHHP